ncbi:S8 family serine peptidase [Paenibacillus lutrae]|uniref:S8 family serine peptidase n=1 Tax=Paenibacillus lutrae TaxID=2078573 RepID=A0A7X3K168_9BACL|nr:S8 family serine peptidase [Paenibacillus lutrae]MVP01671.1 S8 family serine peptidase [Paenibacillus lutrae]
MRKCCLMIVVCLIVGIFPLSAYGAETPTLKKEGAPLTYQRKAVTDGAIPGQVLVKYKDGRPADSMGIRGLAEKSAPASHDSKYIQRVGPKGLVTMEFPQSEPVSDVLQELSQDPNVDYVEPVYPVYAAGITPGTGAPNRASTDSAAVDVPVKAATYLSDPLIEQQWWYRAIQADLAGTPATDEAMAGTVIAVIDTGVDTFHDDLKESRMEGYNLISNNTDTRDDNGHGTNVAGIAAALKNNKIGIAGVASGAKIMPVKVLDSEGFGRSDIITEGIYWAVDHGADVLNLSLTSSSSSRAMEEAIQYALQKGVVVVSASGNDSNHWIGNDTGELDHIKGSDDPLAHSFVKDVAFPARLPGVLAVGAVDWYPHTEFIAADFSNTGNALSVVAPGVDINSTDKGNAYTHKNGTSLAAPMVSGLAALILAADPGLRKLPAGEKSERISRIIAETAADLGAPGFDSTFGSGLIDVKKAMETPRLILEPRNNSMANAAGELAADIRLVNKDGTLASSVTGSGKIDVFAYSSGNGQPQFVRTLSFRVSGGKASFTYKPEKSGKYLLAAYNDELTPLWVSGESIFTKPPAAPAASIQGGTYSGPLTVSLSSPEPGAKIYYTLSGAAPTEQSALYTGPLVLSQSRALSVVTAVGGAVSEVRTYRYEITAGTGGSGSGSGSAPNEGGSTLQPLPAGTERFVNANAELVQENGYPILILKVADSEIQPLLTDAAVKEIGIRALSAKDGVQLGTKVQLPSALFAAGQTKPVVIITDEASVRLEPDSLRVDSDETVTVSLVRAHANESLTTAYPVGGSPKSPLLQIGITAGQRQIAKLQKPMTVTMAHQPADAGTDPEKMGTFLYSADEQKWSYTAGYDADNRSTFTVSELTYAAVFAVNRTFLDMSGHWARRAVEVLAAKQIVDGMDENRFVPQSGVTRAQFAAMLARMLQLPEAPVQSNQAFRDVAQRDWFADAVARAYKAGLVSGVTDDRFAPNDPITREQMAAMLVRAYAYRSGMDPAAIGVPPHAVFADEQSAGGWAVPFLRQAHMLGLIDGYENGTFRPLGGATRAESASVIYRLDSRPD